MTDDQPVEQAAMRPVSALAWARALTDTQITQEQLDELVRIRLSEPSALRDANLLADPNLTAERDRARDIAVALDGQVAAVRAAVQAEREWILGILDEAANIDGLSGRGVEITVRKAVEVRAAFEDATLDPDPADRGTGRDGGGS